MKVFVLSTLLLLSSFTMAQDDLMGNESKSILDEDGLMGDGFKSVLDEDGLMGDGFKSALDEDGLMGDGSKSERKWGDLADDSPKQGHIWGELAPSNPPNTKAQAQEKLNSLYKECRSTQAKAPCKQYETNSKLFEKKFGEKPAITFIDSDYADKPKYRPYSCQWSFDLPRRVINSPGCAKGKKTKTCVGYVICEVKETGLKQLKMATCSKENCGDNDATACTKEAGYSSEVESYLIDTATQDVKSVLGVGAAKQ